MNRPTIGLSTLHCLDQPFKDMTENILQADVSYIEMVDEGLHAITQERVKILNEISSSYDIRYIVHAPFADINIASPSKSLSTAMLKRLKRSLIHASDINCQTWVFHPGMKTGVSSFYPGKDWVKNLEKTQVLFDFAENLGVPVAVENMPTPFPFLLTTVEDFQEFYRQVDDPIGLVLDIGHANLNNQIENFLTSLANRIVHIHAHDNNGKSDQHLEIGGGNIDWKKTAASIKDISYTHTLSVESIENVQQSISKLRELLT